MGELVELIAKALVSNPDGVRTDVEETGSNVLVKLNVDKDDMGKVIGKQGRIAKAIRTVVRAAAVKQNKKVTVDIVDD